MIRTMFLLAFVAGAAAIFGMSYVFLGSDVLALSVTLIIAFVYGIGTIELIQFHKATQNLHHALRKIPTFSNNDVDAQGALSTWLEGLHTSLSYAVHSRIEGESKGLPSPVLTPYLVGLLVMLGLLGTFVGMVDTLQGSVIALQGSTELSAIREGLAAPIKGLGAAFGTSVAGVSASAMLGLMSTLSRRERILVARELDAKINTVFRPFSLNFNRQETYKSLQQQAKALPELAAQITVMAQNLEQMGQRLGQELTTKQDKFHDSVEHAYQSLAESVGEHLNQVVQNSGELVAQQMSPVVHQFTEDMSENIQRHVQHTQAELLRQSDSYLANMSQGLSEHTASAHTAWQEGLKAHEKIQLTLSTTMQDSFSQFSDEFQSLSKAFVETLTQQNEQLDQQRLTREDAKLAQWTERLTETQNASQGALEQFSNEQKNTWQAASSSFLEHSQQLAQGLNVAVTSQEQVQQQHINAMGDVSTQLSQQLSALREQEQERADKALQHLSHLEQTVTKQLAELGQALEQPMSRLIDTASQAPKAAAEVISRLKEDMSQNMARDNDLLEERRQIMSDLDGLSDSLAQSAVNQGKAMETLLGSSGTMLADISERFDARVEGEVNKLSDIAQQFAESSIDIAGMSDAFMGAVSRFSESNDHLVAHLSQIETALESSTQRSDEQLAYYVAQAREIIDHSMLSQKGLIEEINQMAMSRLAASSDDVSS